MAATKQRVDIDGRELVLSNLEKVLYPEAGFTKAQIIDYYIRIAPYLLPHYRDRAVTLKRFPDGVRAEAFYEKDAPKYTPEWVHTMEVPRRKGGKPIRYICIDDVATLVWCANLASLELHPFLHSAEDITRPDSIVFDLDPGDGTDLVDCAEIALLLKDLLETSHLQCLAKVSGSKGLQVYVPLNTATSYSQSRAFAESVAQLLERAHPKRVVSQMAKDLRTGKVFIDWSQNSDFKTTAGVYSLRANADVPYVSAPVTWDELSELTKKRNIEKLRFHPADAMKRVEKMGDLFAPMRKLKQKLPKEPSSTIAMAVVSPPTPKKAANKAQTRALDNLPAAKAAFIEPMLLLRTSMLPEGPEWQYEIKLDGYRALAIQTGRGLQLRSRNDNDFAARYPQIATALQPLPPNTVVDGEIVAIDENDRPSFNLLQNYGSSQTRLLYYLFDLLVIEGKSVLGEPLTRRRELLADLVLPRLAEPVRVSPVLDAGLTDLVASVKEQGFEGLVAKRRTSIYQPGLRSGEWQKMRVNQGQELVIGGYTPSAKNFDALVIGYYEDGKLMYAARTRNGFTPAIREELFRKLKKLEIEKCPFANLPEKTPGRWGQGLTAAKMKECRWLKPITVGQFEFVEWTPENHLRHAKFIALRDDKDPKTVTREPS